MTEIKDTVIKLKSQCKPTKMKANETSEGEESELGKTPSTCHQLAFHLAFMQSGTPRGSLSVGQE